MKILYTIAIKYDFLFQSLLELIILKYKTICVSPKPTKNEIDRNGAFKRQNKKVGKSQI